MMFRKVMCVAVVAIASIATATAKPEPPLPRTIKTCWEVTCNGSGGICISLGQRDGIEVGIPGRASTKKVPCNGRVMSNPTNGTSLFAHDPVSPGSGIGWTNVDAVADQVTREGYVIEYDDSNTYTSYSDWQANN